MAGVRVAGLSYFNPRTPRGVRLVDANGRIVTSIFQSTHPVRGATPADVTVSAKLNLFQSTHPVRGATESDQHARLGRVISIHAPCEGCDTKREVNLDLRRVFQSTHPVRGATFLIVSVTTPVGISIHAPREGCDLGVIWSELQTMPISIHAPREGATVGNSPSLRSWPNFNPRTP